MDGLVSVLQGQGFNARKPKASIFIYVSAPKAATGATGTHTVFKTAEHFSRWLLREKLINTVPWDDAGGYVRFSATFIARGEVEEQRVLSEVDKRLASITFNF
jgi:LL-diaminopimelate aminotransferase